MKKLLITLFFLYAAIQSFGQLSDSTKFVNYRYTYGVKYPRIWAPQVLEIPKDTTFSKSGIAKIGRKFYLGSDTSWTEISGSGSVILDSLRRANYFAIKNGGDSVIIDRATESLAGALAAVDQVNLNRIERRDDFTGARAITKLNTAVDYLIKGRRFYYDPNDSSTPDDSAMTIVTGGGARLKQVIEGEIHPEWWGAVGDGTTNDAAAMNKMYRWIEGNSRRTYNIKHEHTLYLINDTVFLPGKSLGTRARININGEGVVYNSTKTGGVVLYRMPASQSEAVISAGNFIDSYTFSITGLKFTGNSSDGQTAIKMAAVYSAELRNCSFSGWDTAIIAPFWLNGKIDNLIIENSKSVSIKGCSGSGYWSGASTSNSAFNANNIIKARIRNANGSKAGIEIWAGDGNIIDGLISEGYNPFYDIYINSQAAPVVNGNTIRNTWFESNGGTYAFNTCMYLRGGSTFIETLQNDYSDTLLNIADAVAGQKIRIADVTFITAGTVFNGGGSTLSGRSIVLTNMADTYSNYFLDPARWVGGVVPSATTAFTELGIKSAADIFLSPSVNLSGAGRGVRFDASIIFPTDNTYYIGASSSASRRANRIYIGTGGYFIDKSTTVGYSFSSPSESNTQGYRPVNDSVTAFYGTGSLTANIGTTVQRPAAANGRYRYNSSFGDFEFSNASTWYTYLKNPATTAGDLFYWNGTGNTRIGIGSALQSFRVNAAGTGYEFYTPPTGGGSSSLQITID